MVWVWLAGMLFAADGALAAQGADPGVSPPAATDEEEGAGGALPGGPDAGLDAPGDAPGPAPVNLAVSDVPRGPERWTAPPSLVEVIRAARARPLGERIEAASRAFLGLPYLNDAAGEFDGVDPDPPSRYDAFDCLTFVEEVLGLALAGDPLDAPALRDALRYRGPPTYATRRHFMEAQWIPDAIRNGLVEDITARVGRARVLTKNVTIETWKSWTRRALFRLPDAALPVGAWSLTYLDLAEAAAAVPRIPAGAILVTLRQERAHKPIVITHISMVVPAPEGSPPDAELRMRHATRMGRRTVRDDRLGWYVTHLRDYTNWPSLGVTVLLPREQGPRLSALAAPRLPPPFPPAEGPLPQFVAHAIPPYPPPAGSVAGTASTGAGSAAAGTSAAGGSAAASPPVGAGAGAVPAEAP